LPPLVSIITSREVVNQTVFRQESSESARLWPQLGFQYEAGDIFLVGAHPIACRAGSSQREYQRRMQLLVRTYLP
jgi:hypothetical protein